MKASRFGKYSAIETTDLDSAVEIVDDEVDDGMESMPMTSSYLTSNRKRLISSIFSSLVPNAINQPSFSFTSKSQSAYQNSSTSADDLKKPTLELADFRPPPSVKQFFNIGGMTCTNCSQTIEKALLSVPGVQSVNISLMLERAEVVFLPSSVLREETICETISDVGFEASVARPVRNGTVILQSDENLDEYRLASVQAMLVSQASVIDVVVHEEEAFPFRHSFELMIDTEACQMRQIVRKLQELGVNTASVHQQGDLETRKQELQERRAAELRRWSSLLTTSLIFTIPIALIVWVCPWIPFAHDWLSSTIHNSLTHEAVLLWILVTPVQFYVGHRFYSHAYRALKHRTANMDVLISIGSSAAYIYSVLVVILCIRNDHYMGSVFFETSAMLISIIIVGKYIETIVKGKTSEALSSLLNLQPQTAVLLTLDESQNQVLNEETIPVSLVQLGDILLVARGEKIPADGVITKGITTVDESLVTGESLPITKRVGSTVIGGTLNMDAPIFVRATGVGVDSVLFKIVERVNDAQSTKAPIQGLADAISIVFVPIVCIFSFCTWLMWYVCLEAGMVPDEWVPGGTTNFLFAFLFAISVLLISCPCALGLATPTAVMVGTGVAARHGILFKGGDSLEMAGKIQAILFDKTGTLTQGKPSVDPDSCLYLHPPNDISDGTDSGLSVPLVWSLIGNLEGLSEHILGKSIATYARALPSHQSLDVTNFESQTGAGVKGTVNGHQVHIGDARYCQHNGIEVPDAVIKSMAIVQQRGQMAVIAAVDRALVMMIAITDTVKLEAKSVIDSLREKNIHVYMVTGDHFNSATAIGEQLGIDNDHIIAQVSPTQKAEVVSQLQQHYRNAKTTDSTSYVAFCGDGINDSVAIAQADVGIAIGSGTEIAIEAASVVLMRPTLLGVLTAIDCSRVVIRRIRLNFLLAFIYNILAIPMAAGILFPFTHITMPPEIAAMAMGASSISVLSASLLLKRWSPSTLPSSTDAANSSYAVLKHDVKHKLSTDGHTYIFDSADVESDGLISSDEDELESVDIQNVI